MSTTKFGYTCEEIPRGQMSILDYDAPSVDIAGLYDLLIEEFNRHPRVRPSPPRPFHVPRW